ncbi:MAG: DUF4010 domain-containing protein [Deltaproteobacteria bacterium]|nr:DUF4010 domain-containing protein [Deltaproteobacteria bacterium]
MEPLEPFLSLAVAAAAGLLIGLEREQSAPHHQGTSSFLGGARTHPLFALVAGVAMLLERRLGWAAPVAAFAALVAFLVVNYADDVRRGADRGLTSEAAFLLSFLLGALATSRQVVEPVGQRLVVVAAVAVVATLLLSSKPVLRPFATRVSREDVTAALKFLIVSVVVLPLLPDRALGPYGALNPRSLGWMVVLISGISFVGYAAVRLVGPERGLGLTGLVGGLASSTAVTLSMAAKAREQPALAAPCALAVVAASTVMCARVAVLIGFLNGPLLGPLALPLAGMGLGGLLAWLWLRRRPTGETSGGLQIQNPFELSTAFKFGLFFAAVLVGSRFAAARLGTGGIYVTGVLAGTTDVDTIALSMAELAGTQVEWRVAATAVVLGLFSNTVVKGAMAAVLGGAAFGRTVALSFGTMMAGGLAGLLLSWL